jgi:hypothetical protein
MPRSTEANRTTTIGDVAARLGSNAQGRLSDAEAHRFDRAVNRTQAAIARKSERLCRERRVAEVDASPSVASSLICAEDFVQSGPRL